MKTTILLATLFFSNLASAETRYLCESYNHRGGESGAPYTEISITDRHFVIGPFSYPDQQQTGTISSNQTLIRAPRRAASSKFSLVDSNGPQWHIGSKILLDAKLLDNQHTTGWMLTLGSFGSNPDHQSFWSCSKL